MLKAIIFDVYGTLISTGTGSVEAAGKILALNGRQDVSPADFYAQWKRLHRQHIDGLEDFLTEEAIFHMDLCALYARYGMKRDAHEDVSIMLDTLGCRTAFPEVKEVLAQLSQRVEIAIGSTTDTKPLLQDLQRNQLPIEKVFTSESMRVYKPRPAFYETILCSLKINANEAMFVGDSLLDDIWGPQQVGLQTCWINRKGNKAAEIQPRFEMRDLRPLVDIVESEKY